MNSTSEAGNVVSYSISADMRIPNYISFLLLALLGIILPAALNGQIATFPYVEDFEMNDGSWTTDSLGGLSGSSWAWGNPVAKTILDDARSGQRCWTTNLQGNAFSAERSFVQSPTFDFTHIIEPEISFWLKHDLQDTTSGLNIWYQSQQNPVWRLLGTSQDPGWYNIANVQSQPGYRAIQPANPAVPGFSIIQSSGNENWYQVRQKTSLLGGLTGVRFRIFYGGGANSSSNQEGFSLDDYSIVEGFQFAIDLPDTVTICTDMPLVATASTTGLPAGYQLLWSNGDSTSSTTIRQAGWTSCSMQVGQITQVDSVFVRYTSALQKGGIIQTIGTIRHGDTAFICANTQATLFFFQIPNASYFTWTYPDNSFNQNTTVQTPLGIKGEFTLQLSDLKQCYGQDAITAAPIAPPLVSLPAEKKDCDSVSIVPFLGASTHARYSIFWKDQQGQLSTLPMQNKYRFGEPGEFIFLGFDTVFACGMYDTTEVYVGPMQNTVTTLPDYGSREGVAYLNDGPGWMGTEPLSFDWDSSGLYVNTDSFAYLESGVYHVFMKDINGCLDTVPYKVDHLVAVYPGDADRNGLVTMDDLLPLGIYFGRSGPMRTNASLNWSPQHCLPWTDTINGGYNLHHVDVNGDGVVNEGDTLGILLNYELAHNNNVNDPQKTNIAPALRFNMPTYVYGGDTVRIPVMIGDTAAIVKNIYGLAFSVQYDTSVVKENGVKVDYSDSWLGSKGSDMISLERNAYIKSHIAVGMVRNDLQRRAGHGKLCDVIIAIDDHIDKKGIQLRLAFTGIHAINNVGERIEIIGEDGVSGMSTSIESPSPAHQTIEILPNPAEGFTELKHPDLDNGHIYILDKSARQLLKIPLDPSGKTRIDLSNIPTGAYLIMIESEKDKSIKRLIVE
ncbi:MAG: T9SS type A sorting domain-containing protein [Bacteroidia bacterium]